MKRIVFVMATILSLNTFANVKIEKNHFACTVVSAEVSISTAKVAISCNNLAEYQNTFIGENLVSYMDTMSCFGYRMNLTFDTSDVKSAYLLTTLVAARTTSKNFQMFLDKNIVFSDEHTASDITPADIRILL